MKKVLLSLGVIVSFGFYVAYDKGVIGNKQNEDGTPITPVYQTPQVKHQYKDGAYTSSVTDAFFGPLQIKVIITGSAISDIQFLQFPNDRPTSIQISELSLPQLKAEAIQSQSADVEIISGATQTSEAFQVAMKEVLAKAK
jgi:uncharacterized protein with FMN-binding domain